MTLGEDNFKCAVQKLTSDKESVTASPLPVKTFNAADWKESILSGRSPYNPIRINQVFLFVAG
jgi:hypothetical protein